MLLLGGLVLAEKVSALTDTPQLAGAAVVIPESAAAFEAPEPSSLARDGLARDDADVVPAANTTALAEVDRSQGITKWQLFSAQTPGGSGALTDLSDPLPDVTPEARRGSFEGWRTVAGQELSPADDGPEPRLAQWRPEDSGLASQSVLPEPSAITMPQPTWESAPPAPRPEFRAAQPAADRPADPEQGASSMSLEPEPAITPAPEDGLLDRARVVIHRPRDNSAPDARDLLGRLNARGVGEAEIRAVGINVSRADIRYFHAGDRAIAEEVRRELRRQGYTAEVRDFTSYRPLPSRGSVEVWLP